MVLKKIFLIFFLIPIIVFGKERIVLFSGFDRKDVPNLTLHVFSCPQLKELKQMPVNIDVMVWFEQLDNSLYFKGHADNTEPEIFHLDDTFNFKAADPNTDYLLTISENNINRSLEITDDKLNILESGKIISTIPLPPNKDLHGTFYQQEVFLFNNGSSALLQLYNDVYVIKDITDPVLSEIVLPLSGWRKEFAGSKEGKVCFIAVWDERETIIYKFDLFAENNNLTEFCNVGQYLDIFAYFPSIEKLIYKNFAENKLSLINSNTGDMIKEIPIDEAGDDIHYTYNINNDFFIIIGNRIININNGVLHGTIPGFYPISAIAVDTENNYLYYSAPVAEKGLEFTKLICYDLKKNTIVDEKILFDPKDDLNELEKSVYEIHQIFLLPNGKLLALTGTGVGWDDHAHVYE